MDGEKNVLVRLYANARYYLCIEWIYNNYYLSLICSIHLASHLMTCVC
jgi:hypothetical protein